MVAARAFFSPNFMDRPHRLSRGSVLPALPPALPPTFDPLMPGASASHASSVGRREFLRQAIPAGTPVAAAGSLTPQSVVAAPRSPNEKLNIGVVGVAAQGAYNLGNVATENIV